MTNLSLISRKMLPILRRAGVTRAFVFGSQATGLAHKKSDVDLLFHAPPGFGLLELAALRDELRTKVGKEVDLVSDKAIHPSLKQMIAKEAVRIL